MLQKPRALAFDQTRSCSAAGLQEMCDDCPSLPMSSTTSCSTAASSVPSTIAWGGADSIAGSAGGLSADVRSVGGSVGQAGAPLPAQQIKELLFEIESLERALLEEKQRSAAVEEAKAAQAWGGADSIAGSAGGLGADGRSVGGSVGQAGASLPAQQIQELLFEIESLERALLEEKQRSAAVEEGKAAQAAAFARDIAELEAALMMVSAERDRLELENNVLAESVGKSSAAVWVGCRPSIPQAAACSAAVVEYAPSRSSEEPEHEHACDVGPRDRHDEHACAEVADDGTVHDSAANASKPFA